MKTIRTTFIGNISNINSSMQEGSRTDNGCLYFIYRTKLGDKLLYRTILICADIADFCLNDIQTILKLESL